MQGVAEAELLRVACDALVYAAGTFRDRGTRLLTYAWYFIMRDLAAAIRLQAFSLLLHNTVCLLCDFCANVTRF